MKKLEKTKANPLDGIDKRIEKYSNLYDGSPVIHDSLTNEFKTETQMLHENDVIDILNKYEDGSNISKIKSKRIYDHLTRNKNKKAVNVVQKKPIAQRRDSMKTISTTSVPMNLDLNLKISKQPATDAAENILEKIDNDRNKIDPDTFKGLGAFLPRKL
ncbi:hypothetical protein OAM73_04265 [Candidatus Pelagibacter sp.]|nr:hypothetical protein [Candidatus Pelagibacter sp.]